MAEGRICAACGAVLPADSRFCQICGANLPSTEAEPLDFRLSSNAEQPSITDPAEESSSQIPASETNYDKGSEAAGSDIDRTKAEIAPTASREAEQQAEPQRNVVDSELSIIGRDNFQAKIGQINVKGDLVLQELVSQRREQRVSEDGHIALSEILVEERRWVQRAFVKPHHYYEQWQHEQEVGARTFVVCGPEHAGKYIGALHLGMDLLTKTGHSDLQLFLFEPSKSDIRSLPTFARHARLGKNTVYIVRDALENGVQINDLCQPLLQTVNMALEEAGNYLILTATHYGQLDLDAPQVDANIDMVEVFEHYVELFASESRFGPVSPQVLITVRANSKKILEYLHRPSHVLSFGRKVKLLKPGATEEDILRYARQAGQVDQQSARAWFTALPDDNTRLYAMLVALLDGINRFQLDEIYTSIVQWLRKDGVTILSDPRETGLTDLLERVGAVIEANQVRFSDEDYSRQVEREIDNYHHLLWSLKDLILGWAREYDAPEYWELRRNLGAAIGRLGAYHLDKLRTVLNELAHDDNGGVVAVAGYALDAVCRRGPRYQNFALDLLERWVKSGDPWLMWAAGASIWRLYDGLLEVDRSNGQNDDRRKAKEALRRTRDILTRLTEQFDRFADTAKTAVVASVLERSNGRLPVAELRRRTQQELDRWAEKTARSILHAIRRMALVDARGIVELIEAWLGKEEGSNLRGLGRLALYQLFDDNSGKHVQPQIDRHAPLLALVQSALSTDEATVDAMLTTFGNWLCNADWKERIFATLLPIANEGGTSTANALRAGISRNWLEHEEPTIRQLAQTLMARLYVMDGYPVGLPGQLHGLLFVDASREGRFNRNAAHLGRALYQRLDSTLTWHVMHLGGLRQLVGSGGQVETAALQSVYPRTRLLGPILERLITEDAHLALVLTWGAIADIEDVVNSPWAKRLLIADMSRDTAWPTGLDAQQFSFADIENDPTAIDLWVRTHLARLLAAFPSETWRAALAACDSGLDLDTPVALEAAVKDQAARLDDTSAALPPNDIARTLTTALLYLATVDLASCVELLKKWLNSDGSTQRLALASGKMLFRVYGEAVPLPGVETAAPLLALAPVLAAADGATALPVILQAVRNWAGDKEWQARLLARPDGGPAELFQLVDALPSPAQETLRTILAGWSSQASAATPGVPAPLKSLAERLQACLDLLCHRRLPDLADGQRYGLLIIDAHGNSGAVRRRLALADMLLKAMEGPTWATTPIVLFWLGDSCPQAIAGEKLRVTDLISVNASSRPRLIGPLLNAPQPTQVAFVLLLADDVILDGDDWPDTDWGPRLLAYAGREDASVGQQFALLAHQHEPQEAKNRILQELSHRIGV